MLIKYHINPESLKQVDTWGNDGEVLQIVMPSEQEVGKLVSTSEKQYRTRLGNTSIHTLFGLILSSTCS